MILALSESRVGTLVQAVVNSSLFSSPFSGRRFFIVIWFWGASPYSKRRTNVLGPLLSVFRGRYFHIHVMTLLFLYESYFKKLKIDLFIKIDGLRSINYWCVSR